MYSGGINRIGRCVVPQYTPESSYANLLLFIINLHSTKSFGRVDSKSVAIKAPCCWTKCLTCKVQQRNLTFLHIRNNQFFPQDLVCHHICIIATAADLKLLIFFHCPVREEWRESPWCGTSWLRSRNLDLCYSPHNATDSVHTDIGRFLC
jgi:hypothetical protein